jgi:lipopolysaccharide transport system permease protein
VGNAALLTRVYFPRLALPTASSIPPLVDLGVGVAVLLVVSLASDAAPGPQLALAPALVILTALLATGVGALAGSLSVHYRDVQQVFGFALQLWLFVTPIVYPSSLVADRWQWLYHLNPMTGIVDSWRWITIGGPLPGSVALVSLASTATVLLVGLVTFRRLERSFADVV